VRIVKYKEAIILPLGLEILINTHQQLQQHPQHFHSLPKTNFFQLKLHSKMQFTKIASVLAMAAAAIAAPAPAPGNYEVEPRTGGSNNGNNQPACSAQSSNVCCNGLGCLVQILGAGCSTSSYCCESDAPLAVVSSPRKGRTRFDTNCFQGALININALNCVKVL
jgi:hypothetical protein